MSMTTIPAWINAIEEIHTPVYRFQNIRRCSYSHQIGWFVLRKMWNGLSLIHISEPTRRTPISYAVFCLKKKKRPADISYAVFCLKKKTRTLMSRFLGVAITMICTRSYSQ